MPTSRDILLGVCDKMIVFSGDDMDLFARASHDRSPLHCSPKYAHTTPFGQPVVFGVLAALSSLGRLRDRERQTIEAMDIEFRDAISVGIEYQIEIEEGAERAKLVLRDGRRTLLKLEAQFRDGSAAFVGSTSATVDLRAEAADRSSADLWPGLAISGAYDPDQPALAALMRRYRLAQKGFGSTEVAVLCMASYLVGMELPGRRALLSRLSLTNARGGASHIEFEARVRTFDERVDLLRVEVGTSGDGRPLGTLALESFVRRDLPRIFGFLRSDAWKGKTALVIGGSRGLGAALSQALASQGCTVFAAYRESRDRAEELVRSVAGASGEIVPTRVDASDVETCERVRRRLAKEQRRLDLLVCSAFPPLRSLWIDVASLSRVTRYVADGTRMVCTPMAVFLPMLAEQAGQMVLISSAAVTDPPADWPHYISAKRAIEGLVEVAAKEYKSVRFLVVRPPRLLTDLTNTPLGRPRSMRPEHAALAIVRRLGGPDAMGAVEVLDDFEQLETP